MMMKQQYELDNNLVAYRCFLINVYDKFLFAEIY